MSELTETPFTSKLALYELTKDDVDDSSIIINGALKAGSVVLGLNSGFDHASSLWLECWVLKPGPGSTWKQTMDTAKTVYVARDSIRLLSKSKTNRLAKKDKRLVIVRSDTRGIVVTVSVNAIDPHRRSTFTADRTLDGEPSRPGPSRFREAVSKNGLNSFRPAKYVDPDSTKIVIDSFLNGDGLTAIPSRIVSRFETHRQGGTRTLRCREDLILKMRSNVTRDGNALNNPGLWLYSNQISSTSLAKQTQKVLKCMGIDSTVNGHFISHVNGASISSSINDTIQIL